VESLNGIGNKRHEERGGQKHEIVCIKVIRLLSVHFALHGSFAVGSAGKAGYQV